MKLNLSIAYYPQTDEQTEKTIQTFEDMLRACVLDKLAVGKDIYT